MSRAWGAPWLTLTGIMESYLQLTQAFKKRLRDGSFAVTRGGKWVESPAVFVDADDMPGAILPIGPVHCGQQQG
jgi:hypothetical protein